MNNHQNITPLIDLKIQESLSEHASDLDIRWCWSMGYCPAASPRQGAIFSASPLQGTIFHFETTFRHPDLPEGTIGTEPRVIEGIYPPSLDDIRGIVLDAVTSIRQQWAVRLWGKGKLPESGWERDLAIELKLDGPSVS